jgi:hypothetical protein
MGGQDLGRLTPGEVLWMLDGAAERAILLEKLAWDRAAFSTAHIVNCWSKHRMTAERLLGRPMVGQERGREAEEPRSPEEAIGRVMALLGGPVQGGGGLGPVAELSKEERAGKFAQVWAHFEELRDSGRLQPLTTEGIAHG